MLVLFGVCGHESVRIELNRSPQEDEHSRHLSDDAADIRSKRLRLSMRVEWSEALKAPAQTLMGSGLHCQAG